MCRALFLPRKSLIAVLTAYFDESYNHHTETDRHSPLVYTVGCWLSTAEHWKTFGKKWSAALRSAQIDSFHMKEYETRRREYQHWTELKRIGVLKRLHRIIKEHVLYGCASAVGRIAYDEIITPDVRDVFGKTYYGFTALGCIELINEWCNKNAYDGPIHYVFADLAKQGSDLDRIFRRALNNPTIKKQLRMNGMWTKGLMKEIVQLQAADIIAYEINKRAVNNESMEEKFLRKSLGNLYLDHENFDAKFYERAELSELVSDLRSGKIETYGANT